MLLVDVSEAEAKAVGEDGPAPSGLTPGGDRQHPVGGVADNVAASIGGFGAAEVAEGVDELRRIDVLLRLAPPPVRTRFGPDWGLRIWVDFPTLPRLVGIREGRRFRHSRERERKSTDDEIGGNGGYGKL